MSKLWQLKRISTGEALNEPQLLPENWGPIFGLHGFIDQLNDLGWLGDSFKDLGWFVVGDAPPEAGPSSEADLAWDKAKKFLAESDWSVLPDVPMTAGKRTEWVEYRKKLREIKLQPDFPTIIDWPKMPD